MASKKIMASALAGLALCMLACSVQAAGLYGTYSYKLVLRDVDFAIAMGTDPEMNKIGDTYAIEVYNASGVKIGSKIRDDFLISSSVGYNCILEVDMASGSDPVSGYANSGDQLTLVVTYIGENFYVAKGTEVFRSSKILPPVGDWGGVAKTPVGVFYSGFGDTDAFYDEWAYTIGLYCDAYGGEFAGARDSDDDGDGLSNLREYQFGTDPTGGTFNEAAEAFEMSSYVNRPEVGITEQDGGFKVSFNYGVYHVYSVRVIEGTDTVGAAGEDLALYTSLANLNADNSCGKYFCDAENTGTKEFFVKKPSVDGTYMIGLAVDGRLLEYITVEQSAEELSVTPGSPVEYATEAEATAAAAIANVVPSAEVAAALTGEGALEAYKASFTMAVRQEGGKHVLAAQLTPEAQTNLAESATAATRQIPVGEIASISSSGSEAVTLTGCEPGFYYSLYTGATISDIAADSETANLNILCGAGGTVEFPAVKKPGDGAGFFFVGAGVSPSVSPGDK